MSKEEEEDQKEETLDVYFMKKYTAYGNPLNLFRCTDSSTKTKKIQKYNNLALLL